MTICCNIVSITVYFLLDAITDVNKYTIVEHQDHRVISVFSHEVRTRTVLFHNQFNRAQIRISDTHIHVFFNPR